MKAESSLLGCITKKLFEKRMNFLEIWFFNP